MTRPRGPAVYRLFDDTGRLLYVGMVRDNVHRRIGQHFGTWWGHTITTWSIQPCATVALAASVERDAIRGEMPRWNVDQKWGDVQRRDAWTEPEWADFIVACIRISQSTGRPSMWLRLAQGEYRVRFGCEPPTRLIARRRVEDTRELRTITRNGITVRMKMVAPNG